MKIGVGLLLLALASGCVASNTTVCANGRICPEGTACDETHGLCVLQSQFDDCAGKLDNEPCVVNGTETVCRDEVCLLQFCGDGIKSAGEQCDGEDLAGGDCTAHGFYQPEGLGCSASCTFDTTNCTASCGDGIINGDELCDGTPPARDACTRLDYDAGLLGCSTHCGAQTDACRTFGWTAEDVGDVGFVRAIWANSPDDIYVGGGGGVFHFDGTAWTPENTGLTGAATVIWGRAGEVFAAGYSGQIAHLVNGTWTVATVGAYIPDISGSGTEAYAVGATIGYASFAMFRSSSGGAWTEVPGFSAATYGLAVKAMGPTDVYVLDNLGVQHWDGTSWTRSLSSAASLARLFSAGPDLYAIGPGSMFHHDANGWTQIECPFSTVTALAGTGANDLYAIGNGGAFFHYDGIGWISIASAPSVGGAIFEIAPGELIAGGSGVSRYRGDGRIDMTAKVRASFKAVYAKSATEIVAVGDNGLIARYSGDRWHLETASTTASLYDVWGDFAVGSDNNTSTILHWSGTAWTPMSFPGSATTIILRSVWGSGPSNVYAVGDGGAAFHYDGSSWTALTVPLLNLHNLNFVAVWGTASNDVYFAGNDQIDGGGYIVTGGPSTFSTLQQITSTTDFLSDVWASGPGDVWLVGSRGGVYHGSGTTFASVPSGTVSDLGYIAGSSAGDFRVVLKVGYDVTDQYIEWSPGTQTFSEKLYFCDNPYTHQRLPLVGMAAVQSGDFVAVGANSNALRNRGGRCTLEMGIDYASDPMSPVSEAPDQLYYTTRMFGNFRQVLHYDGEIVSGIDTGVVDADVVWASSPSNVWALGKDTRSCAHFDGTSWTVPENLTFDAKAIGGSGPTDVWIVGSNDIANHWDGASWTPHPIPVITQSTTYHALWSLGPNRAVAASWEGSVPLKCWDGTTWATCPGAVQHADPFVAFGGTGPSDVWAAGPAGMLSHWNGTTWTDIPIDHPGAFVGVAAAGPNDVFAIDYGGAMMHFDGSQWSPVRAGSQNAFAGLTYSSGVFWSVAALPAGSPAGLVRATVW